MTLQTCNSDGSCPSTLEQFHNITFLSNSNSVIRNISEIVYRGVKATDGQTYCLRRVSGNFFLSVNGV